MYILLCSKSFKLGFPRNWFCSSLTINCIIITVEAIQWLDWGNWTHCTRTCGPGVKFRARSCSKPDLAGTSGCLGNSTEIKPCLEAECPGVFFCKCLLPCYFDQSTCYWLPLPGLVTHSLTHSLGLIDVTLADDSAYSKTVFVLADVEVGGWESICDGRATAWQWHSHTQSLAADWTCLVIVQMCNRTSLVSSVRSSKSHPDLLLTLQHPFFQIHTGPQHWTFTFWTTIAI